MSRYNCAIINKRQLFKKTSFISRQFSINAETNYVIAIIEREKVLPERTPALTYMPADPTNCLRESRGVRRLAAARELDSHGRRARRGKFKLKFGGTLEFRYQPTGAKSLYIVNY